MMCHDIFWWPGLRFHEVSAVAKLSQTGHQLIADRAPICMVFHGGEGGG